MRIKARAPRRDSNAQPSDPKMTLTMTQRQPYLTVNVSVFCACPPIPSVTWTVRVGLSAAAGVPEITAVEPSSTTPAGNVSAVIDHVKGLLPLVALSVAT